MTPFDLALGAVMAETVSEVERVEYLALLLLELPDCRTRLVRRVPGAEVDQPLVFHFTAARARVGGQHHNEWLTQLEHANRAATDHTVQARKDARRRAIEQRADVFAGFSRT